MSYCLWNNELHPQKKNDCSCWEKEKDVGSDEVE
jgi:hypothetical protein